MRVREDLVDRAHRGAGDSSGGEARLHVGEVVRSDPRGDQLVRCGAILQPRRGGGEPRILRRVGRLDRLAEADERLVPGAGDGDPSAVACSVDVGRHDGRRLRAKASRDGAGSVMADDDFFLHAERGLIEADVHDLTVAAPPSVEDGHQERRRAEHGRPRLGQRHGDRQRRAIGEAGRELDTGECLRDPVVAALARQRAGLAERRDAQQGQTRIARVERLRRETE